MFAIWVSNGVPSATFVVSGVGQPATLRPSGIRPVALIPSHDCEPIALPTVGVGHPVESLADVRGTDARSAGIDSPEGVTLSFHVRRYKVEPRESILARNLLPNDDWRAADADEVVEGWP